MKKAIILLVFACLIASCSPKEYHYKADNLPGVRYKKSTKQAQTYVTFVVIGFFVGYSIHHADTSNP